MTGRERLAVSARALHPLGQGSLDGLCGLYAAINAVRLALYPDRRLTRPELAQLFGSGLETLRQARALHTVILDGMPYPLWRKVSAAVLEQASTITGYRLELVLVPLRRDDETFALLRQLRWNLKRGHPVLLLVEGRLHHWTVVYRVSRARITLFDSSNHAWLSVRLATLDAAPSNERYHIARHGILALHRHDPPP